MYIPTELIDPDPEQPRKTFDAGGINELAASLKASGQAVAILVRPAGDRYVIVHGERRWRAARQLGWPEIRAEVREVAAADVPWLSLVENLQRSELSPVEEAEALQRLATAGHTQTTIAGKLGKTQSYVAQKLRLLKLPEDVRRRLNEGALSEGHARQLLRLCRDDDQAAATIGQICENAVENAWSVKRVKLEVDFKEMTWLGYWGIEIDDRWKFGDLVALRDAFAVRGWADDASRLKWVDRRIAMIERFSDLVRRSGGAALADAMIGDMALGLVYWFTRQCADWEKGAAADDVSLLHFLRWGYVCAVFPDEAKHRLSVMLDGLPHETWVESLGVGLAGMIGEIGREFVAIVSTNSQPASMSRDILPA